jgi:hypothetical protein
MPADKPASRKPASASRVKRQSSADDIAQTFSVNEQTVRRWAGDGCPHLRDAGRLLFNEDEVNKWVRDTKRKTTPGRPPKPKEPVPEGLEGDKDYWLARKYRNQCLREEGKLVDVSDVERWLTAMLGVATQQLNNLAAAVVPRIQGMTPAEQEHEIQEAVDACRRSIATELPAFGA